MLIPFSSSSDNDELDLPRIAALSRGDMVVRMRDRLRYEVSLDKDRQREAIIRRFRALLALAPRQRRRIAAALTLAEAALSLSQARQQREAEMDAFFNALTLHEARDLAGLLPWADVNDLPEERSVKGQLPLLALGVATAKRAMSA